MSVLWLSEKFPSTTSDLICTSCAGVSAGLWPLTDTSSCLLSLAFSIAPTRKMNNEWIIPLAFKLSVLLSPYVSMYHLCSLQAGEKCSWCPSRPFYCIFHLWPYGIWKAIHTLTLTLFYIYIYIYIYILFLHFLFAWPQGENSSLLTLVARQQIQSCTLPSAPECHVRVRYRLSWDSLSGINWPVFSTAGNESEQEVRK